MLMQMKEALSLWKWLGSTTPPPPLSPLCGWWVIFWQILLLYLTCTPKTWNYYAKEYFPLNPKSQGGYFNEIPTLLSCVLCKETAERYFEYLIEVWEGGGKVVRDIFSHRGYVQKKFQIFICKCEFPLGCLLITPKGKQEAVQ